MVKIYTVADPPIPIEPNIKKESINKISVSHAWVRNNVNYKQKYELPVADQPDLELLLYVIKEFDDASANNRLNLSTANIKFQKFREVLADVPREEWDEVLNDHGAARNDADWTDCRTAFIARFVSNDGCRTRFAVNQTHLTNDSIWTRRTDQLAFLKDAGFPADDQTEIREVVAFLDQNRVSFRLADVKILGE